MKKRIPALLLCMVLMFSIGIVPAFAENTVTVEQIDSFEDGLIAADQAADHATVQVAASLCYSTLMDDIIACEFDA